jgi:predicted nucleic acid-binding protein
VTFLDTGFLFALISKRDAHHRRVVDVFRTFKKLGIREALAVDSDFTHRFIARPGPLR